tara:strand:- start:1149 stop:1388 length:240 start_codon:yes stop_codon:yes gene_type:complete
MMATFKKLEERIGALEDLVDPKPVPDLIIERVLIDTDAIRDHGGAVPGLIQGEPFLRYIAGKPGSLQEWVDGEWRSRGR